MNEAVVEKTKKAIVSISTMDCIKPYYLVGGTALSLQINHRLSEDLDFMRWQKQKNEKMSVDVKNISLELKAKNHTINSMDILEHNHVEFLIDDNVKLSFYAPEKREPVIKTVPFLNNINLLDTATIASLKMEVLLRRSNFRDYYDLYFILKDKTQEEIISIINNALKYSGHALKSKNLIGKLLNHEQFKSDEEFRNLAPKSNISAKEIAAFMEKRVKFVFAQK
ncbi:MAG: nucleotidyl transferase AbiEii/AbiGii toxin family protein [Bacteroidetes bacterium]|nr:nucleotidyl transferase AbiEii/AbiGii toxin family protein [Bacteroidota bacterium]